MTHFPAPVCVRFTAAPSALDYRRGFRRSPYTTHQIHADRVMSCVRTKALRERVAALTDTRLHERDFLLTDGISLVWNMLVHCIEAVQETCRDQAEQTVDSWKEIIASF